MLTLENCFQDDAKLRRVFSWLSRIGAAPKFGSRPIGWYQIHQCKAIEHLAPRAGNCPLRVKAGMIQKHFDGMWINVCTPSELFSIADKASRQ